MPDGSRSATHFRRGVELFNRGEFFEAHEEMEEAMNLLDGDESDWEFYLGLLRAAVANHKLADGILDSAILHLRAALKFLAPYPDRHRGIMLREFRNALTVQLDRLLAQSESMPPHTAHRVRALTRRRIIMKLDAEFVTSVFSLEGCPRWNRAEVALAGRSNVGKSSLLNALTGIKGLARTSKTPGRTQSINLFAVGDSLALADLPGYGYAKMPEAVAQRIASSMSEYLQERENLAALVMLIDSRRGPGAEELDLAEIIRKRDLALIVVATKCDKLKRSERARAIATFKPLKLEPILCSVTDGEGIEELRRRILKLAR